MSVKIRLRRMGAKGKPFYRLVVTDSRMPRDGRFIEQIGYYNPLPDPPEIKVDERKAFYWLDQGAQPTNTVRNLLKGIGVMKRWKELQTPGAIEEQEEVAEKARTPKESAGVEAEGQAKENEHGPAGEGNPRRGV